MNYRIELPKYGDAANDGKGELLRNATIMYNGSIMTIVNALTGSPTTVNMDNWTLPVARGGTGGNTALKGRLGLGIFIDSNNEAVFGSRAISLYDGSVLDHDGTVKPTVTKNGVGDYTIQNVSGFALAGFTFRFPKDAYGNPLVFPMFVFNGTTCNVKTYKPKLTNGLWGPDITVPMNIPAGKAVDISVK